MKNEKIVIPPITMEEAIKVIHERTARAKKMVVPFGLWENGEKKEPALAVTTSTLPDKLLKEDEKRILEMECKKHYKMYLLHKSGYSKKQIAELLAKGNVGYVSNELKRYEEDPKRAKKYEAK